MNMCKLRNGSEEPAVVVQATMLSVKRLEETDPLAAYDLAMMCKTPGYKPFGKNGKTLDEFALTSGGVVNRSVKNIVLSAVVGDGLEMRFQHPVAN